MWKSFLQFYSGFDMRRLCCLCLSCCVFNQVQQLLIYFSLGSNLIMNAKQQEMFSHLLNFLSFMALC